MKKVVLITARSKSSRLKSKILRKIGSLRAIDILILRAEQIKLPIILATSKQRSDDKLCNYVKKNYRIKIFRGDNKNKLKRWYKCFQKYIRQTTCTAISLKFKPCRRLCRPCRHHRR